jgi:predicted DNA-binding transcriptional regulator AlpA
MIYESTTQSASTTQNVARATQSAKHTQNVNTTQSTTDNEKLLTTTDIAERLGLSKKSVTDYINKGILPTIQPKGARTPHFIKESDYPAFELYYRNLTGKSKP